MLNDNLLSFGGVLILNAYFIHTVVAQEGGDLNFTQTSKEELSLCYVTAVIRPRYIHIYPGNESIRGKSPIISMTRQQQNMKIMRLI